MDITETVNKLKKRFNTLDPEKIAEQLDAIILKVNLPDSTRGFFQLSKRIIVIYINCNLEAIEQRNVLAHELSHAILHKNMNRIFMDNRTLNVPNRYENQANFLAAYMIIDDHDARDYIVNGYTYEQISRITGVKEQFVKQRIDDYISIHIHRDNEIYW